MVYRGLLMGGTAVGGLGTGLTGGFVRPENVISESFDLADISLTRQLRSGHSLRQAAARGSVAIPEKMRTKQNVSKDLDHYYSGLGRYLSEGGDKPIYYVDHEGRFKVIEVKGHSQGQRNLWGGRNIGAHGQRGYGPRGFPFNSEEKESDKGKYGKRYLSEIKRFQQEELESLSNYLNEFNDDQGCEIIDVIGKCDEFKKKLMTDDAQKKKSEIKTEFQLKLDAIAGLAKHDEIDTAGDDLSSAIAKTIYIEKLKHGMQNISKYGVEGYKEYYNGRTSDKVNPVALIADIRANKFENIGYDCARGEKQGKDFFKECDKRAKAGNGTEAKVVRVLKTTVTRWDSADRKYYYYAPAKKGLGGGLSNKQASLGRGCLEKV